MTLEFQQMLALAAMGAAGNAIDLPEENIDWEKVIGIARRHRVDTYVAYALKNNRQLSCPVSIYEPMIKSARSRAFSNALQRSAIIQLLEEMEEAGIHGVLLKGYAIADCYWLPECRLSGDADIWVNPKDEDLALEFMKSKGFSVSPRWKNGHHAVCHHPTMGCVEIHVILYDEIVEEIWFGKMDGSEFVTEAHMLKETEDGKYYTLGITDHFIFLALHMIKHFIMTGLTVQMMLDVSLYFKKHAHEIDANRAWTTLKSLKYENVFNCILWAMIEYCGFKKEDFPGVCREKPAQIEAILSDLEEGGWMGFSDEENRKEGWYEYNRQVMLQRKSKVFYYFYMFIWNLGLVKTELFPPVEKLKHKFPYARKHPVLVPVAWLHRLIFRGGRAVKNGALTRGVVDESTINSTAKERVNLFKDLDMM
ncbi:MAG: hypothetical protein E7322_05320 [Clostridiales bacterium]|nr:hypothetical protein [Clostridiales bacterium]